MSPRRVSELITADGKKQPLCFCSFLMMHLCLLRDRITPLRKTQCSHSYCVSPGLPPCFPPRLFTESPVLFNYGFSAQSLLNGCMSDRTLAQSQATARVQKSPQIILNLPLWATVQKFHLQWASVKSALTASEHWATSTASTVSSFEWSTSPCTRHHAHTAKHQYAYR